MIDIPIFEPPDSRTRYHTIMRMLDNRTGELNEELMKSILSDHTGLVCSRRERIRLGTLWSLVANLNELRILRAEGHPCKAKYREDNRLKKALERRS